MKKIGILTFHRSINYGAFMQAFALSREIQNRFPTKKIEIIDFELLTKHNNYRKPLRKGPLFFEYWFKYQAFQSDLEKLPLSSKTFITDDFTSIVDYIKREYDIVIVGSDAVWAFQKMGLENPYWLFGKSLGDIVKMSYAASAYSTDFKLVTDEEKAYIAEMLADFQYIGVRDTETYNFIKSIKPEKELFLNCDPTFLLPKSQDFRLANKTLRKNLINPNRQMVSFMTSSMPYIKEIKASLNNSYTYIHFNHRDQHIHILDKNTKLLFNLSPTDWYNIYCKCTLNFTDYFHGTLLGLRNGVPTFSIDKTDFPYPYIGKIEQVMTDLDLKDYVFLKKDMYQKNEKDRLFSQIDFSLKNLETERIRIDKSSDKEKEKSETFFKSLGSFVE
ncbi:MAG: polysaccharide pyruvyl transferase family protein [Bacteroidales bacterium]|nr:polysaccharide pyruvyl transferase family protein [Bacteroidales bacterium]MCF8390266.1 polysaccharide pyruvyl transferase family protein [Bacteroidales bacterium]